MSNRYSNKINHFNFLIKNFKTLIFICQINISKVLSNKKKSKKELYYDMGVAI